MDTKHLDNGVVQFPPNVHGIYIQKREDGLTDLTLRQNDTRLSIVLDAEACAHLARLLEATRG